MGTRKWSYLRWVSMMDRECCSTLLSHIIWPSSTGFHSRHVLQYQSDCCSTTWCTGTCLHVGFIWWHRARPRVTLLISSQVDKKKIIRLCFICYAWYSRQIGINHFYSFHIHTSPFCLLFHKRRSECIPYNLEIWIKNDEHQFLCNYRCHCISFNTCFLVLGRNPLKSP